MLDKLLPIFGLLATREPEKAIIDDIPFQLQYVWTTAFLFVCSGLISMSEIVGKTSDNAGGLSCFDQVNHDSDANDNWDKYANFLCLATGTYVYPEDISQNMSTLSFNEGPKEKGRAIAISYFQWIPYILLAQGLIFYLPRLIWVRLEEGKLTCVLESVKLSNKTKTDDKDKSIAPLKNIKNITQKEALDNLAKSVVSYINMKEAGHNMYGYGYLFCQVLLCITVGICFLFSNHVLDGQFLNYGRDWILAPNSFAKTRVLDQVFPNMARCDYRTIGSGGGPETRNLKCILAPNSVTRYVFLIMWIWYVILGWINTLNLLFIIGMMKRTFRLRVLLLKRAIGSRKIIRDLENPKNERLTNNKSLSWKIHNMSFGQFLFLYLVLRNSGELMTTKILEVLAANEDTSMSFQSKSDKKTSKN